ncbi:MAG: DUF4845 domain-containing protein [Burkholderiaceae bacterium]
MIMNQFRRPAAQRGTSLLGLVVLAVVVGFVALLGIRTFPSVNEYLTIRQVVGKIMKSQPAGANEIRQAFERSSEVEYSIKSITAKDLVITPVGERWKTSYAYNVEIPIIEPVFLLVKYEGSAASGGGAP